MDEQGVREQRVQERNTQRVLGRFFEQSHGGAGRRRASGAVTELLRERLAQAIAQGRVQSIGRHAVRIRLLQRVQLGELLDEMVAFVADRMEMCALRQRLEQQRAAGTGSAHEEDGAFETDGHGGSGSGWTAAILTAWHTGGKRVQPRGSSLK